MQIAGFDLWSSICSKNIDFQYFLFKIELLANILIVPHVHLLSIMLCFVERSSKGYWKTAFIIIVSEVNLAHK